MSGCALLYAVAFFLLVWRVKEGEYPPPDAAGENGSGRSSSSSVTPGNASRNRFYLKIFSVALFYWSAWVPFMTFVVFYATKTAGPDYAPSLGVSVAEFGKIKGWTFLPKVLIFACLRPADRQVPRAPHPAGRHRRLVTVTFFAGFFVVHTPNQFLVLVDHQRGGAWRCFQLAYLAMFPVLLPREKYGQFFSANQLFFSVGLVVAPFLCGWLMDVIRTTAISTSGAAPAPLSPWFLRSRCTATGNAWAAMPAMSHRYRSMLTTPHLLPSELGSTP